MEKITLEEKQLIKRILNAGNPIVEYVECLGEKQGCYAFFCDGIKNGALEEVDISTTVGRYYVTGACNYRKAVFMDAEVVKQIRREQAYLATKVKKYLGFDSNFISDMSSGLYKSVDNEDLYSMLKIIKRSNCEILHDPYYYEDVFKESGMKNHEKVYEVIKNFCTFARMTDEELQLCNYTNIVANQDDVWVATEILSNMIYDKESSSNQELGITPIYCLLLETNIIKNGKLKNADIVEKYNHLIHFINEELGVYLEDALFLCMKYLVEPDNPYIRKFFGKMALSSKNLLRGIESMAWDLYHYKSMPLKIVKINQMSDEVALYYFITGDKGFSTIMEYNPIERLVVYKGVPYVKYRYSIQDISEVDSSMIDKIIQGEQTREQLSKKVNFKELAKKKEEELLALI